MLTFRQRDTSSWLGGIIASRRVLVWGLKTAVCLLPCQCAKMGGAGHAVSGRENNPAGLPGSPHDRPSPPPPVAVGGAAPCGITRPENIHPGLHPAQHYLDGAMSVCHPQQQLSGLLWHCLAVECTVEACILCHTIVTGGGGQSAARCQLGRSCQPGAAPVASCSQCHPAGPRGWQRAAGAAS